MRSYLASIIVAIPALLLLSGNVRLFMADYNHRMAWILIASGDLEESSGYARKAVSLLEERADYHRTLGNIHYLVSRESRSWKSDLLAARKSYLECSALDSYYPYCPYELALTLSALRKRGYEKVEDPDRYFEEALRIDPNNPRFLSGALHWNILQRDRDRSKRLFARLCLVRPDMIPIYGPGVLRTETDLNWFGKVIGANPALNLEFSRYLLDRGNKDAALSRIKLIPEEAKTSPRMAYEIRDLLVALGQKDEARRLLEEARKKAPAGSRMYLDIKIAELYLQVDNEKALEVYKRALRENPDKRQILFYVAKTARRLGKYDEAKRAYEEMLYSAGATRKNKIDTYLEMADMYMESGRPDKALESYTEALMLDPDNSELIDAVKRTKQEIGILPPP